MVLIPIKTEKQKEEEKVREGSRIIAQGYRSTSTNSIFSTIPKEIALKIATSIADNNHLSKEEALEVARSNFSKPR